MNDVDTLPLPQVLHVEADKDNRHLIWVTVRCPRCRRTHTHDVATHERWVTRTATCTLRLGVTPAAYDVDLTGQELP